MIRYSAKLIMTHRRKRSAMKSGISAILHVVLIAFGALTALAPPDAQAASYSGDQYGPFDYSNPEHRRNYLAVVDGNHFNKDVQNLVRGQTGTLHHDIKYCLRIFPNHHPALDAMARLYRRDGGIPENAQPKEALDIYFQRAFMFSPMDPVPHMIYAVHFQKTKDHDTALTYYENAMKLGLDNVQLYYNLGLLHADMGNYEESLRMAKIAYEKGHPLPGLRNKLIQAGAWE